MVSCGLKHKLPEGHIVIYRSYRYIKGFRSKHCRRPFFVFLHNILSIKLITYIKGSLSYAYGTHTIHTSLLSL